LTDAAPYTAEDVTRLIPIAGVVSLKLDNVRLLEAQVRLEVSKRELEAAQSVQENFLPRRSVCGPEFSFHALSRPCQHVGGDCLDFVEIGRDKLALAIGDVAGKGLPAALYMVGVLATLRAHLANSLGLQDIMVELERYVRASFKPDHFLTLFLGQFDCGNGRLTYCNAGHLPPILIARDGRVSELETPDPALNITPWGKFSLLQHPMDPGDLLLVFTDGLTENANGRGEEFGVERLVECARANAAEDLETIGRAILTSLSSFGGARRQHDDMALMLLRREDPSG
jgi:sigma-B regulation protein RsbU (phosphoserine phosphatase)